MLLLMPQVWIMKGRRAEDEMYRSMWERAMDDMIARLVVRNGVSGLTYVASLSPCASFRSLNPVINPGYIYAAHLARAALREPPVRLPAARPSLACCLLAHELRRMMLQSWRTQLDEPRMTLLVGCWKQSLPMCPGQVREPGPWV